MKKIFKYIIGGFMQYTCSVINITGFIIMSISQGVLLGVAFVLVFSLANFIFISILRNSGKTKFLRLTINKYIAMKPVYIHSICENNQAILGVFNKEFEVLLEKARKRNKKKLIMQTHEIFVNWLLKKYVGKIANWQVYNTLSSTNNRCTLPSKTKDIEKIEVIYIGDLVNNCAKYKYSPIMNLKQFKDTFKLERMYRIIIYLS